ncbi:MAG TPA: S8 family serine peptidase [Thermoanaerobaculia bacterium]|nr:S8 family serine peptidase [Thermoanaerobaculia bacterium]
MHPVLGVLLFATSVAAANTNQTPGPARSIVRTNTGKTIELSAPQRTTGPQRRIVEFREAPLARRTAVSAASTSTYRATFDRFRRDLAAASPPYGKQAVESRVRHELFRSFHGVSVTLDDAEAAAVRRLPYVKAVHEDRPVKAFAEDTTRIERIRADRVWSELQTRGDGIRIAVLDTGVDYHHPALAGNVSPGYDFIAGDDDPMDEHGHGTHVAGIIVGETDDVRGVAPGVRILAYRVLNADGQGYMSDVVAAIDHVLDPDGDGDFGDRAEIINLSLGSHLGDADDPSSLAVDAAVMAGIVVCVASGNEGMSQSVGAPASSRLAITVGNSDVNDLVDFSSSYGPTFPDYDPKPELVAPGTEIRSAALGGGSRVATGTSMAAPHVAGAAALLLALHPEWTPEEVKGALTSSAELMFSDVMQQGAGRLDAYGAATMHSMIAPALVSIGRSPSSHDWTATRTVRVTNRGAAARTYTANVVAPENVSLTVEPAEFTLEAGASRDVVVNTDVQSNVAASAMTMAFGGRVDFESAGAVAVRVPWVGLRAARTTVNYDGVFPSIMWSCSPGPNSFFGHNRAAGYETLLPYGACTLLVYADGANGEPTLVVKPELVTADLDFNLGPGDAPHRVRLAGVDRSGKLLSEGAATGAAYFAHYYVDLPGLAFQKFLITTYISEPFRVSSLASNWTVTPGELLLDLPGGRIVSARYPETRGLHADLTRSTLPSDLHHARVQIAPQRDTVLGGMVVIQGPNGREFVAGAGAPFPLENGWAGDVFVTADADARTSLGGGLLTIHPPSPQWDMYTETFRAIDGRVGLSDEPVPAPDTYTVPDGGTLPLGKRPLVPHTRVDRWHDSFTLVFGFSGMAGELYGDAAKGVAFTIRDASGTLLDQGIVNHSFTRDYGRRGLYGIDLQGQHARVQLSFDTSREDYNPPLLNSLRIENGTVRFAVGDWQPIGGGYLDDSGDVRFVTVTWRGSDGLWHPVPLTKLLEDRGPQSELGHFPTGIHYQGPFPTTGYVDLRVEMEDGTGNKSVALLDDVFGAGVARRRAVGK